MQAFAGTIMHRHLDILAYVYIYIHLMNLISNIYIYIYIYMVPPPSDEGRIGPIWFGPFPIKYFEDFGDEIF